MSEDVSNRGLAVLLVLAIVVSIGGTMISLNKMGTGITGYATDNETGTASLEIESLVQITLTDASVDYGICGLNSSQVLTYDSNGTGASQETDDSSTCSGTFPDVMTLENTGNKDVNLTIASDTSAADFVNAPSSDLKTFAFVGITNDGGCVDGLQTTFTNFTAATTDYLLCNNFTTASATDEVDIGFRVTLPPDAVTGVRSATITITGEEI
jgi:hypothetical protein